MFKVMVKTFRRLLGYKEGLPLDAFADTEDLDRHQVRATTTPSVRTLVIAGAGSGKTRVLVRRVAALLGAGVPLNDIRIVTFTRPATDEMLERLSLLLDVPNEELAGTVSTIHQLAIKSLDSGTTFVMVRDSDLGLPNNVIGQVWRSALTKVLEQDRTFSTRLAETIRKPPELDEADIYDLYAKQNRYPEAEVTTQIGIMVRSELEANLADLLFKQGIRFEYERPVLFADFVFRPDFYLNEVDAYVEVLGFWNNRNEAFKNKYRRSFEIKKAQMAKYKYGAAYLELYPYHLKSRETLSAAVETFISRLKGYKRRILNRHQDKIQERFNEAETNAVRLLSKVDEELRNTQTPFSKYKTNLRPPYLELAPGLQRVFAAVDEMLTEKNLVTGARLFERAAEVLETSADRSARYIFIDEFQDVQPLQMRFLKHYMDKGFYVIGDPRQAIFAFLGGSTHYIENLRRYFPGTRKLFLHNNYRSQANIVALSNRFLKGFKPSKATKEPDTKVVIYLLDDEVGEAAWVYDEIKRRCCGERLMVLGRYNMTTARLASKPVATTFGSLAEAHNDTYTTFHRSKGKEADHVVIVSCSILNPRESVPARDADHPLVAAISDSVASRNQLEEERRLFYVAMTRARRNLFFVGSAQAPSPFLAELERYRAGVEVIRPTALE